MLLPWAGTTVLSHQVASWRHVGAAALAVVHAADDVPVGEEVRRHPDVAAISAADPDGTGMLGSIRAAVRWPGWPSHLTHFVVALGDQPHLRPATLAELLAFARRYSRSICQLSYQGTPQHPVVFPRQWWARLESFAGPTLAEFLEAHGGHRAWHELPEPNLARDLDTPADYASFHESSFS